MKRRASELSAQKHASHTLSGKFLTHSSGEAWTGPILRGSTSTFSVVLAWLDI